MRHLTHHKPLILLILLSVTFRLSPLFANPPVEDVPKPIEISNKINRFNKAMLNADLDFLQTISNWKSPSHEELLAFGLKESTPKSLVNWLTQRVSFIVPASTSFNLPIITNNLAKTYPSSHMLPGNLYNLFLIHDENRNSIMANLGTSFYLLGKNKNQSLSYSIKKHFPARGMYLPIMSPRVGLLEAYPAFFSNKSSLSGKGNQPSDRIMRLSYIFHEGRHSDGSGETLGFYHRECPIGHDYAGLFACDTPSNGSYRVSAIFLRNAIEACLSCTEGHKEALRLAYFDARNRIVDRKILTPDEVNELNDLENKLSRLVKNFFGTFHEMSDEERNILLSEIEGLEEEIDELKNTNAPAKVYWNATPEALQ